ncbi:Endopolyphosphatase [Blyttiomyces sp. JEL0837]|nr:Endopolyphosphatase [Blyttiomyces sp. JEL0837]
MFTPAVFTALLTASSVFAAPCIPPVQRSGKFLHVTDIHIDSDYIPNADPTQLCHRVNSTATMNTSGKFGALGTDCDTPFTLLDSAFHFLTTNTVTKDVDFIIYTGDTARHDRDLVRPRTEQMVLDDHNTVTAYFGKAYDLSKTRIFPTIGNNDPFGHNDLAPGSGSVSILSNLTSIWKPYGLGLEDDTVFRTSGYYVRDINERTSILSLNTMWLYKKNLLTKDCNDTTSEGFKMLNWMNDTLTTLETANKKAYVIGHIPPKDEKNKKAYQDNCYASYLSLIAAHNNTIISHFHGHTNEDSVSFLTANYTAIPTKYKLNVVTQDLSVDEQSPLDTSLTTIHVFTNGPSIIPVNNPAVRVYNYDVTPTGLGNLIDYTQFWTDLKKDNAGGDVVWETEYVASTTYGMTDLSTQSWIKTIQGFWAANSTTYAQYANFFTVGAGKA